MTPQSFLSLYNKFISSGIESQIDYDKFYLYSLITHSTAIEGSTVTEVENHLLFDEGLSVPNRTMKEQLMNLDLKSAYEKSFGLAEKHSEITVDLLKFLSSLVMKNTGTVYKNIAGEFSSAKGELRLVNVSAGRGGSSYMSYTKVPAKLEEFCNWLNKARHTIDKNDIIALYNLSFDAHYNLVTIHPWADGNGRMSRLLMNMLQFEAKIIPVKVSSEHKSEYIEVLENTRETEDLNIFRTFMLNEHAANLQKMLNEYNSSSISDSLILPQNDTVNDTVNLIFELIKANPKITYSELAKESGKSRATVARAVKKLSDIGAIRRAGADKNGFWEITI